VSNTFTNSLSVSFSSRNSDLLTFCMQKILHLISFGICHLQHQIRNQKLSSLSDNTCQILEKPSLYVQVEVFWVVTSCGCQHFGGPRRFRLNVFLWNVGIVPQHYTVSHLRRRDVNLHHRGSLKSRVF